MIKAESGYNPPDSVFVQILILIFPQGFSMSPVWLEEGDTGVIIRSHCASEQGPRRVVIVVELHSASPSNQWRSHVQVVRPYHGYRPSSNDEVCLK